jgi:hypothetical protein
MSRHSDQAQALVRQLHDWHASSWWKDKARGKPELVILHRAVGKSADVLPLNGYKMKS